MSFNKGDLVWFDPEIGYLLPGQVFDYSTAAQVVTIEAVIDGESKIYTIDNLTQVQSRNDNNESGVEDMIELNDLHESSLLWNLKVRYQKELIYTFAGNILIAINPYKMFDIYGLNVVKKYDNQILGTLPPHLFAIASAAYSKIVKDKEDQVIVICGESGAGKSESCKLIMQYLSAVNKSASNIVTEQLLEANPLFESFGNAKTSLNNNSSRFGKYLEVNFKDGYIVGAQTSDYLLEKSRVVSQLPSERNFHIFYEILTGLTDQEKEKYGLESCDKYFYLNQNSSSEIEGKNDAEDFRFFCAAIQVLGFTNKELDTIYRILSSVLHLGNVYFNRKQLKHGQEGVEIGSDKEIRWTSQLLQVSFEGILKSLTIRTTELRGERIHLALNIDHALDVRDAIAKALYSCLFSWLIQRINMMIGYKGPKKKTLALVDLCGFENFNENNFEQLCINYLNEMIHFYFTKHVFKLEQQEYLNEKLEWQPLTYYDNQPIINLIAKKPIGLLPLLDDESNFPKASDHSFLEKCHYNHALNDLYSRPRMSALEFGIKHFAGQVWYSVEGFLNKNRDTLRQDVIELMIGSRMAMISKMFQNLRYLSEPIRSYNPTDDRFVTIKPRTPTVSARFQDSLSALLESMSKCNPWFVRCIKPNNTKAAMLYDCNVVLNQLKYSGMLSTIKIRKYGYPIRIKFAKFVSRYRCFLPKLSSLKNYSTKETCKCILDNVSFATNQYVLASSKIFMKEKLEINLEKERNNILRSSVIIIQRYVRGYIAKKKFKVARSSAIKIQSTFRGYQSRKVFKNLKKAVIKAQAIWKMKQQKREYDKIKAILNRKKESDRLVHEKVKGKVIKENEERLSRVVAGVNLLEIPAELAYIFSKLDNSPTFHSEKNIVKAVGNLDTQRYHHKLPLDIDQYAFTKFTNIYFRAHVWGMKREPIKTPFLTKTNEADYQESLVIFKLILRFMNDSNLSGKKEKILADYIIQKGLSNEHMRDEILCQLCNQTWKNENEANNERGWLLMAACLSCFPPSSLLYKYILKYASDHGFDGYKNICQSKLVQAEKIESQNARIYPPCLLEWKSISKKANMTLEGKFSDDDSRFAMIDSWTTGENFASDLLHAKGLDNSSGWTIELNDEGDIYELNGNDYVFDLISEMEVVPSFPVCKSYFLISPDHNKKERKSTFVNTSHNPEKFNKLEGEANLEESINQVTRFEKAKAFRKINSKPLLDSFDQQSNLVRAKSLSKEHLDQENVSKFSELTHADERVKNLPRLNHRQSHSLMALDTSNNISLSKNSRLNRRYLSKDDKINADNLKLSETSKLNKRYVSSKADKVNDLKFSKALSPVRKISSGLSLSKRSISLQELGLATSALNDRYFSSRQLLHKASSLTDGSEILEASTSKAASNNSLQNSLNHDMNLEKHLISRSLAKNSEKNKKKAKHVVRPSSNSSGSSISSGLLSDYHGHIFGDTDTGDLNARRPSADLNSRYVKYSAKNQFTSSRYLPYNHSTKAYIDRNTEREGDYGFRVRSSAMSDTSEAPSLASHVKNVKIPSHNADLDQYLDDLFNPVLDGNLDELSDAKSLAASIKGGYCINANFDWDINDDPLIPVSSHIESVFNQEKQPLSRVIPFEQSKNLKDLNIDISEIKILEDAESLVKSLKGGANSEKEKSTITFTTSKGSENANFSTFNPKASQKIQEKSTPNINTNMPFTNIAGMTVPMVGTSQIIHQQLVHQQMIQRAYLASAVQQNLQIQQQLLQQNQAFQQLLQSASSSIGENSSTPKASPSFNSVSSFQPLLEMQGLNLIQMMPLELSSVNNQSPNSQQSMSCEKNSKFNNSVNSLNDTGKANMPVSRMSNASSNVPPAPPPPPPPLSPSAAYKDVYGREKTIRIGKWRWPPPLDGDDENNSNSFLEFKIKKHQEKQEKNGDYDETLSASDAVTEEEIHFVSVQPPESFQIQNKKNEQNDCQFQNVISERGKESVGKIRISSEMKAKLEQLTIDQTVRSKKDSREKLARSMEDIRESKVKKLAEHRKALLEKQLMGSMLVLSDVKQDLQKPRNDKKEGKYTQNGQVLKQNQAEIISRFEERFSVNKRNENRHSRERLDELGPHHRVTTKTSTIQAECNEDNYSQSLGNTYFDQISNMNSMTYEENTASTSNIKTNKSDHDSSRRIKRMSVPPPPPPSMDIHENDINSGYQSFNPKVRPSSIASSSGCYDPSTSIVIKHKNQPPLLKNFKNTGRLFMDKLEFVETNEFLKPVDAPPPEVVLRKEQKTMDMVKTKLYPPIHAYSLTYSKVPWKLKLRKEVFSPLEKIESPVMLNLIFCQIIRDAYSPNCIRLNKEERQKLRHQLNNYNIKLENMLSSDHKLPVQRNIIEFAKELSTYFCRLFPVSGGQNLPNVELLGVSHSKVRLIKHEKEADCESLRVLDTLDFDDIAEINVVENNSLQLLLKSGGWLNLFTPKANQIRNMIESFTIETNKEEADYVQAVSDYNAKEPSLLTFRKGDVIRIVKSKNIHISKGWLYGILESGKNGIFPCEHVVPLNKKQISELIKKMEEKRISQTNGYLKEGKTDKNTSKSMTSTINLNDSLRDALWVDGKVEQKDDEKKDLTNTSINDGKFSLLQFALYNFRDVVDKYEMIRANDEDSLNGSIKILETLKSKKKNKKKIGDGSDWTWREFSDLVKFSKSPITSSLLKLNPPELNKLAVECFSAIMQFMGDLPMAKNQTEVDCVYAILVNCYRFPYLRDEIYCQLMKQTTNNKSAKSDSCQRGWRLFSIVAAYFDCSEKLRPYLFKFLETSAFDKRRAYYATAMVCLQNLRKTMKYNGRKNVPSIEEIAAISAGRNSKRQMYRLPGGTERIINTKSSTVVYDIIEKICSMLNVTNPIEMEEFSLYCIVEGDPYTMPLNRDEYVLDITTELLKNGQTFYLIFCRSVWFYPLRLDCQLYIEVIFNQVAPDYLEGLLLVIPEEKLSEDQIPDIARIAALLHRAADMEHMPSKDEVKYLLPKPLLPMKEIRPPIWVEMVQKNWLDMSAINVMEAKAQCLDILQKWPLFGSCFFAVRHIQNNSSNYPEYILALNKEGAHFLDLVTHETIWKYLFVEIISTRKVRAEDGTLYLDMKCGNLMVQKITRIQTDQAHEISRLIRQYIEIQNSDKGDRST